MIGLTVLCVFVCNRGVAQADGGFSEDLTTESVNSFISYIINEGMYSVENYDTIWVCLKDLSLREGQSANDSADTILVFKDVPGFDSKNCSIMFHAFKWSEAYSAWSIGFMSSPGGGRVYDGVLYLREMKGRWKVKKSYRVSGSGHYPAPDRN